MLLLLLLLAASRMDLAVKRNYARHPRPWEAAV
jgi:hypothetical protein